MAPATLDRSTLSDRTTLQRARSALGQGVRYRLGTGGMDPNGGPGSEADCSGFVAWAIGIPRRLPTGEWLSTDEYYAGGVPSAPDLFVEAPPDGPGPGDLYVYPDSYLHGHKVEEGHIGIITEVVAGAPALVIHCSSGNDRRFGDAVQETDPAVFLHDPASKIMRVEYGRLGVAFGLPEGPSLILATPDPQGPDGEFAYRTVPDARFATDHFEVQPRTLGPLLGVEDPRGTFVPIESLLAEWGVPFEVDVEPREDARGARVYVFAYLTVPPAAGPGA